MGFYKQTTDLDLGETSIENIFINDFMPQADGTAVKVYLLAYKYSQEITQKNITHQKIAKELNIPLEDVHRSWDFWASKKIIKKIEHEDDYDIEFLSIRQMIAKGLYSGQSQTREKSKSHINMIEASKSPEIRKMFYEIDQIMRRQLVPHERNIVLEWLYEQNIQMDIIIRGFKYCAEIRNVKHINYVASVIRGWHDKGIVTEEQLDEHFEEMNSHYKYYRQIYDLMGYGKKLPSAGDKEVMDKWLDQYNLEMPFITQVITEMSKKTSNINMNYIDKSMETLYNQGITTVEGFNTLQNQSTSTHQKKPKNNQFHNFSQREKKYSNEELEKKLGIRK